MGEFWAKNFGKILRKFRKFVRNRPDLAPGGCVTRAVSSPQTVSGGVPSSVAPLLKCNGRPEASNGHSCRWSFTNHEQKCAKVDRDLVELHRQLAGAALQLSRSSRAVESFYFYFSCFPFHFYPHIVFIFSSRTKGKKPTVQ